ncbi:DUF692 family multinuclear iron-containing protein [Hymenobacter negativus]|uniref:DUF692 family protein n=1 Tax=Hymenobacter negativus TaxID=2795026 RepID=A0ABS3Q9Z4_9BACT|nr:DUF692 family multinuclear iron-containing protein [Hymenobacter negativus]MBO2007941.1 DUF692 family protein [Hymenobacter negativus]
MDETPPILASLACNLDSDILTAALPLLEAGQVEALEWSFDTLFRANELPEWFTELLHAYGNQQRLVGHGVFFSLLSSRWTPEQQHWLTQVRQVSATFAFDHITEHFGFFTGQNFHSGAPLPVPYTATALRIGQDRLRRIYDACQCPVGLENLAFAYSLEEVEQHGEFLEKLIAPVNGFIILDLHNLYCQLHNFSVSYEALIDLYPLDCVREIHISGGSWDNSAVLPHKKVRRDTHDDAVPEEVFRLLALTMPKCANLKFVVLEQLGTGLQSESSKAQFQRDFQRMANLVQQHRTRFLNHELANTFRPLQLPVLGSAIEDSQLHTQQVQLSDILENAATFEEAHQRLHASSLANSAWKIEAWEPHMLETAVRIAQKWKK